MSANVVKFEVIRESYRGHIVDTTIERTCANIIAATGYIKRHRDELHPYERFGLRAVIDTGERVTLH